jgi:hypothetical protein
MNVAPRLSTVRYFLSATNPLATADQRDLERRAIALMNTPAYGRARLATERRWGELAGSSRKSAYITCSTATLWVTRWRRRREFIRIFSCHSARKAGRCWKNSLVRILEPSGPLIKSARKQEPQSMQTAPPSNAIRIILACRTKTSQFS